MMRTEQNIRGIGRWATTIGLAATIGLSSCTDAPPPPPGDSASGAADESSQASGDGPASNSGWDGAAGPFVVLPTVDGAYVMGSFLLPDATELTVGDTVGVGAMIGDGAVDLFNRSGQVLAGRLQVEAPQSQEIGCTAWLVARIRSDSGVVVPWTAAFRAGRVQPVALDSIEGMTGRDSALFAAALARLASGLPDDTSSTFRGRPFVVLRAWRTAGSDSSLAVATLVRRVNQEDNPREERLVMIIDTPARDSKQWKVGWHERASGAEDELVVAEPLLAFRVRGSEELRVLFGRDDGVALGAAVLTRQVSQWRVLWESAVAGCE
ncbi:MAG: hypothetical protein IBJ03_08245 [Gemmatimonadaceae bacterium]|nr:hypothetical protein [Gemmatimonadaceae bacterium]